MTAGPESQSSRSRQADGSPAGKGIACVAALFSMFVFAVSANMLPAVLIRAASTLGTDPTKLSTASSIHFAGFFLATLAGGAVCDRIGKKPVFLAAAALMLVGAVTCALARSLAVACAGSLVLGMGGGVMESMGAAVMIELFPSRRQMAMNLSQVIFCAGAVGGPLAIGWLLPRGISWRLCFTGLAGLCGVMLLLYLPTRLPAPAPEDRVRPRTLLRLMRHPATAGLCLALFCYVMAEFAVIMFANYYLREHLRAPEGWAIAVIACIWGAMGIGRLVCAAIPERHHAEHYVSGLMLAAALLIGAQVFTRDWRISFALFVVTGIAYSGTWPLIVGLAATRARAYTASVVGITIAVGSLGCVAAPPVMRWLFAACPGGWPIPLTAVPLAAGAALVHLGRRAVGTEAR